MNTKYLSAIHSPADVKKLNLTEKQVLAQEMRQALLERLSQLGGHCGSNMGVVELTIALHSVFSSPEDKIIFDTSHQTYPHKMLTGRNEAYLHPKKYQTVSGFSAPAESEHDFFIIGHTSTSVSLACGMAKARDLCGKTGNVIAVIGDGSLSGGEALEGLDMAGELQTNLIIIINDNGMSIAENHGGMYPKLKALRDSEGQASDNLFKAMGLEYIFVKDGNDIQTLTDVLTTVKDTQKPVAVHIATQKGKGYTPAETSKEAWHWCKPFDIETGKPKQILTEPMYEGLTAEFLLDKMQKDKNVIAITSGVPTAIGFHAENRQKAGKQFLDVGIAEQTAVAIASGIAKNGGKPVYGVYSTFLQRAYDQIAQEVCINESPVTFLVCEASVWGMNDVTHLGIYDIPLLGNIPNLIYLAPTCKEEYFAMLDWSIEQNAHPVAIRVPTNGVISSNRNFVRDYSVICYEVVRSGRDIAILALGDFFQLGEAIADALHQKGLLPTLVNPRYISDLDTFALHHIGENNSLVITLEDGILSGGFGEKVAAYYSTSNIRVKSYGLTMQFYDRFQADALLQSQGISVKQITQDILDLLA